MTKPGDDYVGLHVTYTSALDGRVERGVIQYDLGEYVDILWDAGLSTYRKAALTDPRTPGTRLDRKEHA